MNRLINIRNIIGIILILFGTTLAIQQFKQVNNTPVVLLNIKKPNDQILSKVQPISNLVTDPTDRAKLAIFNQEFANRILKYSSDNQQTNDVYVLAGGYFFKDSIKDKYDNLDIELVNLLESIIGKDNHILSQEEKTQISDHFMGLAWSLIQKR